ncbi:MAG: hypothetical protein KF812_04360 [Fimbriimonadaceae bacterium]|nr:hypothetical protein [Fimbriimonadaceae bacterium]
MDARAYGWGILVVLAGVAVAQWPSKTPDYTQAKREVAAAKIYSEWDGFAWPRQSKASPPVVDRARQVANAESARITDANAVTVQSAEELFTQDPHSAEQKLAGRAFAWSGEVAEFMSPGGDEALVIFHGPAPRAGWSLHLVFNGKASQLGNVQRGQSMAITGRFAQRLVDETNFVVSYLIEDAQVTSRGPAPAQNGAAPSGNPMAATNEAPKPSEEARKFSDLTKGWRYAGHVVNGDGAVAVFVSPEGRPTFARAGKRLADGLFVKALEPGRAVVVVDSKALILTPW